MARGGEKITTPNNPHEDPSMTWDKHDHVGLAVSKVIENVGNMKNSMLRMVDIMNNVNNNQSQTFKYHIQNSLNVMKGLNLNQFKHIFLTIYILSKRIRRERGTCRSHILRKLTNNCRKKDLNPCNFTIYRIITGDSNFCILDGGS